jgi:hypothetical protein
LDGGSKNEYALKVTQEAILTTTEIYWFQPTLKISNFKYSFKILLYAINIYKNIVIKFLIDNLILKYYSQVFQVLSQFNFIIGFILLLHITKR